MPGVRERGAPVPPTAKAAFAALLAVAGMLMLWVWTGAPGWALGGCALLAAVVLRYAVPRPALPHAELHGGPLDGHRVPALPPPGRTVVLRGPDGTRIRYRRDGSGRLRHVAPPR
ncbi:hypothetical protein [Nocardiopsis composta]|uniref:Uncharacterized protein n=1 Tax=Nocardiopsis composta TaxID=157465 RepID=A0A7W8QKC8_9ACTN|nr:hypothetical protein [Nocardiopsis composta]MBB5432058.1 hypothetical protein [Nocardiopsis composta]